MFTWNDDGKGDGARADALDMKLPNFYMTGILYLTDAPTLSAAEESDAAKDKATLSQGQTEFIAGSHKLGILEVSELLSLSCDERQEEHALTRLSCIDFKAGDFVLFNGKVLHRGMGNDYSSTRHALYIVYAAKWYRDA